MRMSRHLRGPGLDRAGEGRRRQMVHRRPLSQMPQVFVEEFPDMKRWMANLEVDGKADVAATHLAGGAGRRAGMSAIGSVHAQKRTCSQRSNLNMFTRTRSLNAFWTRTHVNESRRPERVHNALGIHRSDCVL
eukprot:gene17245-biopygen20359